MPILYIPKSPPKPTLEEARASDQIVEYESAGITYSYTPKISWIDGHEWANPRTIEERTESTDTSKTTKSWLLAQCLWWDLWKPGLKCPRSVTKDKLSAALYNRIMRGGLLSLHPEDVWDNLKVAWTEKYGSDQDRADDGSIKGSPGADEMTDGQGE